VSGIESIPLSVVGQVNLAVVIDILVVIHTHIVELIYLTIKVKWMILDELF